MACADETDPAYQKKILARNAWLESRGVLVTSDYVFDETLTLFRTRLGLAVAQRWWQQLEDSSFLKWEWVGPERADKARELFFRFRDKDFSFTDCTSFVIMKELRINQALTTDHHFVQMGYEIL